ncbi:MAG: DUF1015 domain-containing protein [Lachnospiraceae bacterium]|nr:DUF1015 domain-containing protein [Lachnospiraceae bacterium]
MADIRPFRAVRPAPEHAADVAALPYDVYSREEAADKVKGHPLSFLNIDRPETMFDPDEDMYADKVYAAAAGRYEQQKAEGIYRQDAMPCFYIYEETMDGRRQTGIAALSSVDDYLHNVCKKHENTVEEKERDRIRHVDTLSAQTGPIFLSYHGTPKISGIVSSWKEKRPEYDFVSDDGIGHRVWVIDDRDTVDELRAAFGELDATYIADGHHRAASAVKVALKRREAAAAAGMRDDEIRSAEFNYFLSVLFPDEELKIMDYNRVVRDLNAYTPDDFLEAVSDKFEVQMTSLSCREKDADDLMRPREKYEIGMYLNGRSYLLRLKEAYRNAVKDDPVQSLDVSVLQNEVLAPLLGIGDPRTDKRIRFIGGIRGLGELVRDADRYTSEQTPDSKAAGPAVAFAMYPTDIRELFRVADAGLLMPPKSTWFEPKLRSGLFIHEFERIGI